MRNFALVLVAALSLGAIASAQSSAPGAAPAPDAVSTPGAIVHIKNFAFNPSNANILVGQSVKFVEDDDTPHTVTAVDKSFDSGNLDKGSTWTYTFATAGTYAYFCAYHPYMKGTVTVK
jgi:plastocyanin